MRVRARCRRHAATPKSLRARLGPEPKPIKWHLIYRAAEQRLKARKWEIGRYTLSQILNALDQADPDDPHAGGIPINSLDDLDDLV
jgi:hypothetical protein